MAAEQQSIEAAGDGSVRYYLIIDGMDGGSTNESFTHSFEIDGFSLGTGNVAGIGGQAGKTTFDPLDIDFASGSAADEITRALVTGQHTKGVRLVGVTAGDSPQTVYDLRLGDVIFTSFEQTPDGDHLAIDYSKITLTTPDSHGAPETSGWDRKQNVALTAPLSIPGPADDNADAATGPLTWYLTIDGLDGGSSAKNHEGAFELSDSQFDIAMALTAIGGGGAGKPRFDPLALKLDFGSAADEILAYVASNKHIPAVQVEGVTREGVAAYDLRFGDALLRAADLGDDIDRLNIDYTRFSLTTTNSLGVSETQSYDRKTLTTGNSQLAKATASDESAADGGDGAVYYLAVDGLDGGSTARGHKGAFEISGFDFDILNSGLNFGGGGSGKTKFMPLDIGYEAGSDMTRLLRYVSTGEHIRSIQITGAERIDGKLTPTGFDLRMADVTVESLFDGRKADQLALAYGQYTLTTRGTDGVRETSGWDIAANKALSAQIAAPKAAERDGAAAVDNMRYYLVIGGMDGGSNVRKHEGAFAVDDFHLDAVDTGGKTKFSNLEVDLKLGSAVEDLLALAASGKQLKTIQLVGDTPAETPQTVYDLRLGGAALSSMLDTATGRDHLSFSFNKYSLATVDEAGEGDFYGYNIAGSTNLDSELAPAGKPGSNGTAGGNLVYFMTIDGLDGGSHPDKHASSFALSDFEFDFGKAMKSGRLSADVDIGNAGDELMSLIANGKRIKNVEIAGDKAGEGAGSNPYDLRLGNVTLTALGQDAHGHDRIGLQFSRFTMTTKDALDKPHTSGIDLATHTLLDSPLARAKPVADQGSPGGNEGYHLLIDGLDGGDRHQGREGAFTIDDFNFDISAAVAQGGGAGKTVFRPIGISFDAGSSADELLELIASDTSVAAVQIVGDSDGKESLRTFDLRLADVHLSGFHQGSAEDEITLRFGELSLTTLNQSDTGSTRKETYHYDVGAHTGDDQQLPPAVPEI